MTTFSRSVCSRTALLAAPCYTLLLLQVLDVKRCKILIIKCWPAFLRNAFRVEGKSSLYAEIEAGLKLYVLIAELLEDVLQLKGQELIEEVLNRASNR